MTSSIRQQEQARRKVRRARSMARLTDMYREWKDSSSGQAACTVTYSPHRNSSTFSSLYAPAGRAVWAGLLDEWTEVMTLDN